MRKPLQFQKKTLQKTHALSEKVATILFFEIVMFKCRDFSKIQQEDRDGVENRDSPYKIGTMHNLHLFLYSRFFGHTQQYFMYIFNLLQFHKVFNSEIKERFHRTESA